MRTKLCTLICSILLIVTPPLFAQDEDSSDLKRYILNLGKYLGFDLEDYCPTPGACTADTAQTNAPAISQDLLDAKTTLTEQLKVFGSYLGTLFGGEKNPIVPEKNSAINEKSANVYQDYASQEKGQGSISVSPLIDQETYQDNPVRQAILDMLSTPDESFCKASKEDATICKALSRQEVLNNLWKQNRNDQKPSLPAWEEVFSPNYNLQFVAQLNSDILLMPLLYSSQTQESNTEEGQKVGLPADTQAEQAANFIRYVTGMVTPVPLPTFSAYSDMQIKALDDTKPYEQKIAQSTITEYLAKLKTYAAQTSVPVSNFYYILSKRLPQKKSGSTAGGESGGGNGSNEESSAALDEFKMATWRLFDTSSNVDSPDQWVKNLQKGSIGSVEKEIAVLLAEINYQLYLTRQINERLLLTQSILVLQNARNTMPNPKLQQYSDAEEGRER